MDLNVVLFIFFLFFFKYFKAIMEGSFTMGLNKVNRRRWKHSKFQKTPNGAIHNAWTLERDPAYSCI